MHFHIRAIGRWKNVTVPTGSWSQQLTTSFLLSLEQLNWKLYPAGDINEYDGLTDLFVKLTENDLELFDDPYIKRWYKLSVGMK